MTCPRVITITHCTGCPYCRDAPDAATCWRILIKKDAKYVGRPLLNFPMLPDWCPLPPAPEGHND